MKMNAEVMERYLHTYLQELERGKESFFITITDFEPELADYLKVERFPEYHMVIMKQEDYSHAVALRNNPDIQKIVLLTQDCTRKIDSLKVFQEYPFFARDSGIFWKCIEAACEIREVDKERRGFVDTLMQEKKVYAIDVFEYLLSAVEDKRLSAQKLNENLPIFQCFGSKDTNLKKAWLKKRIRSSEHSEIDRFLRPAILDSTLKLPKKKAVALLRAINEGNYQNVYEGTDYEVVKGAFQKSPQKRKAPKEDVDEPDEYQFSYEALLEDDETDSIEELEELIQNELESGTEDVYSTVFEHAMNQYEISPEEYRQADEGLTQLLQMLDNMRLNKVDEDNIRQKFLYLQKSWRAWESKAKERVRPYLLNKYCDSQEAFVDTYLQLCSYVLLNDAVLAAYHGEVFYEKLQLLFCSVQEDSIRLPFYHPIMGVYYLYQREIFRQAVKDYHKNREEKLRQRIIPAIAEKKRAVFPIRFLSCQGKLYEMSDEEAYGREGVRFGSIGTGIPDFQIEFGMFYKYILHYINRHPYQPQLQITVVDIGNIKGIDLLFKGLGRMTESGQKVLERVTLHIVSQNERQIKQELEKQEGLMSGYPSIRFRFSARKRGEESQRQLEQLVRASDILILADSEYIYEIPRLIPYTQNPNSVTDWMQTAGAKEYVGQLVQGNNRISVLWETMQNANRNMNCRLSIWSYREASQHIFEMLDAAVGQNLELEVIMLSSNTGLMRMIQAGEHYHARIDKSKIQDILILSYVGGSCRNHLTMEEKFYVQVMTGSFLPNIIRERDWEDIFSDELLKLMEHLMIHIELEKDIRFFYAFDSEDEAVTEELQEEAAELLDNILKYAFEGRGVLAEHLKDILLNECYQRSDTYSQVLGVYRLSGLNKMEQRGNWRQKEQLPWEERWDCMESIEFRRIVQYLTECQAMDSSSITRFNRYYDVKVLNHMIEADKKMQCLPEKVKRNAEQIFKQL